MSEVLPKFYDFAATEAKWYSLWEERGYFRAVTGADKPSYCITIPPPNVTGELHMGHAIQHAIHDLFIRWKRMQGFETLCLPGTDHAGIATQMKVEQELAATEGKTRYDVGREALLERIWAWKEKYGGAIYDQLRRLGCSYDWQRARFTLDEEYVEAVLQAFERFHQQDWIYRGKRMINWCPSCRTVISDLETEERELQGHLWHICYRGVDGSPDVVVATTRPETMLGDTGVAVHPQDERWQAAIGQSVNLPLMDRSIPIVADEYADPTMGSGAVKLTPAHDPNDYEVGQRHSLPQIQVIGFDGHMTNEAGRFNGQERYKCRQGVIAALEEVGLLVEVEEHLHAVPHHDKCGTVIEPLPMEQWFMDMKPLAEKVRPHLERQEITYVPDRFRGYALEWLDNIRDWALSRQIWWGHRIPAWYCKTCSADGLIPMGNWEREKAIDEGSFQVSVEMGAKPIVSIARPPICFECGGAEFVQDPDVLDTWFSSALWPFATLGWPQKTEDVDFFYSTDLMITARDILYLWVLRMAMTSVEFIEQIPFKVVYVHPTVLTKDGQRMSKSLGTGLNPLDLVDLYGTDATRFSLIHQIGSGQDVRFDAEIEDNAVKSSQTAENARNFCNKLWNATRFVTMNLAGFSWDVEVGDDLADRWMRSRLATTIRSVTQYLEAYRLSDATRALYDFLWHDYCDWYVEMAKARLNSSDEQVRLQVQQVLVEVLEQALRLMHPVMPFITETLWQALPARPNVSVDSIMVASWPQEDEAAMDSGAEAEMAILQEVVTAVRTIRGEMNIPPGKKVQVILSAANGELARQLDRQTDYIALLAKAEEVQVGQQLDQPSASGSAVLAGIEVYVPLAGSIDMDVEQQRLEKEIAKYEKLLKGLDGKLANKGFVDKAPTEVVERERQRQLEYGDNLKKLQASLERLKT
jgi:valyl-tRNA synthetase